MGRAAKTTTAPHVGTVIHAERKGSRPFTAEDLWALPRVGAPVPSPDGRTAAVAVKTHDVATDKGRSRIWLVPLGGGEPRPLTSPDLSSAEPAFSPDGKRLAFTRKAADEKAQLFVMPLDGGEAERLTDMPLGVFDPKWLPDGRRVVFVANLLRGHLTPEATKAEAERRAKDPVRAHVTEDRLYRYWDRWLVNGEIPHLFVLDLGTREVRDLIPDSTAWFDWMEPSRQYDVAPDGSEVAYAGHFVEAKRDVLRGGVFVVPVAGGAPRCLTTDHPANDVGPRYSPDGATIVYGSTKDLFFYADRTRLMAYHRATGEHLPRLEGWDRSPSRWEFAPDGTLYLTAESEARSSLYAWKGSGKPRLLVKGGWVTDATPTADGRVVFSFQTLSAPPEVWRSDGDGTEMHRVTRFTDEAFEGVGLGEVREVGFEGAAGEKVQQFLVLPPGGTRGGPLPLVQVVHGGPHAVSADSFHWRWNAHLFAAPGYAVGLVNFQGSTSWGQDFAQRIQGAWAERPFEDVMRATDVLVDSGVADARRMALIGGSYGGYMAAWVAGHTDRFRCIVNHAGVYDTLGHYGCDITQGRGRAYGGEPWDGLDRIDRNNPARFVADVKTPMLVTHGEKDFRVPAVQGLQCYNVLKSKGVPARLVYFPDENHWILKPRNSLLWYREVHDWLARFLSRS
jgi:dipeptidyl aminopeptidase/acylaminoacyl peptidase